MFSFWECSCHKKLLRVQNFKETFETSNENDGKNNAETSLWSEWNFFFVGTSKGKRSKSQAIKDSLLSQDKSNFKLVLFFFDRY